MPQQRLSWQTGQQPTEPWQRQPRQRQPQLRQPWQIGPLLWNAYYYFFCFVVALIGNVY